jgi:hypothetical protein
VRLRVRLELTNTTGSSFTDLVIGPEDVNEIAGHSIQLAREGSKAKVQLWLLEELPAFDPFTHNRGK